MLFAYFLLMPAALLLLIGIVLLFFGRTRMVGVLLSLFGGAIFITFFWNTSSVVEAGVRKWTGRYKVGCVANGLLYLGPDGAFSISTNGTMLHKGTWEYVLDDDRSWVELRLEDGYPIQLLGEPDQAEANYVSRAMGGSTCAFMRIAQGREHNE